MCAAFHTCQSFNQDTTKTRKKQDQDQTQTL